MSWMNLAPAVMILFAMGFFAWLVYQSPVLFGYPVLPAAAMASVVSMFRFWMTRWHA